MLRQEFDQLAAAGYNRIPVYREIAADLDTPLSVYLKLANQPYSFLLESVQGGERWGRHSIIGLPCRERLEIRELNLQHICGGDVLRDEAVDDPLTEIDELLSDIRSPELDGLPPVSGGLFGYFGHDTVRYIEPRLNHLANAESFSPNPDQLHTPDILLLFANELIVFDNLRGVLTVMVYAEVGGFDAATARVQAIFQQLQQAKATPPKVSRQASGQVSNQASVLTEADFDSEFPQAKFEAAVGRVKAYIREGDIMQVVPSQRLRAPFVEHPLNLYRAIRRLNPSPYLFYFDFDNFHVVGSSPEILVKSENGTITVRPIAGTRPRGASEAEDLAYEQDLLSDPKEIAEHLMLIDLGRNDVGRVAEVGQVELTEKMVIERYSHVMHIVSNVNGQLRPGLTAIDALRATFPAGTLSGAPKIRALEIIDELEPVKRGIYGGAVGYIGYNGNMDTAIAIRTAIVKDGMINIQAGAGLVADSIPQSEWEETLNKARAMMRAAGLAATFNGTENTGAGA